MTKTVFKSAATLAAGLLVATTAAACSGRSESGAAIDVVVSFYPLQFVAERVGGDDVSVTNLTPAGAEPHDMELEPRQMADITDADLVVYLGGFQPEFDAAIDQQAGNRSLDIAAVTEPIEADEHDGHDHEADDHEGHDHGGVDPHVWLDPTRMVEIVSAVADRFAEVDPEHADTYRANATTLTEELTTLDGEYEEGLAQCDSRDLVVSHAAFGYLAARYDLHQIAVSGLTPEADPGSDAIATVSEYVREHGVTTVFYETLVDPQVAETIADETGADTAVLDPIEGLAEGDDGDYLSVMRSNLSTLRPALGCE